MKPSIMSKRNNISQSELLPEDSRSKTKRVLSTDAIPSIFAPAKQISFGESGTKRKHSEDCTLKKEQKRVRFCANLI